MKYLLPTLLIAYCLLSVWACQSDTSNTQQSKSATSHISDSAHHAPETSTAEEAPQVKEKEMYENTNRMVWQKPDLIMNMMGDLSNKTVADIGAGTGFFAKRLAKEAEKVIAIDVDQRFLNYIDSVKVLEMPEREQAKLETRLAQPDDPNLAPGEVDVIMIVNTFIYIRDKKQYLQTLKRSLSEGGELFIIDFKKKRTDLGPPSKIRMPLYQIEDMLYEAGYTDIHANDTALDYQYIISGSKPAVTSR
ncbi:MAG: methyltransferase domain-containing protein [Bacteroidetes bacterium]|nr:methyltransferase domain-containing protein [Bacteroidota bacterium]